MENVSSISNSGFLSASLRFLGLIDASAEMILDLFEPHTPFLTQFLKSVEDLLIVKGTGLSGAPAEKGQTISGVSLSGAIRGINHGLLVCWVENISFDELSIELGGLRGSFYVL